MAEPSLVLFKADKGTAEPQTLLHRAASQAPAAVITGNASWQLWGPEEALSCWSPGEQKQPGRERIAHCAKPACAVCTLQQPREAILSLPPAAGTCVAL